MREWKTVRGIGVAPAGRAARRRRGSFFRSLLRAVFLASTGALAALPASARQWNPTPAALARDYSQITDVRTPHDMVTVWWLVPQLAQKSPAVEALLTKYVVLGVNHAHVSIGGQFTFDNTETLQASGGSTPLKLLTGDAIPPAVAGTLTTIEAVLRQALGPMGQGVHWFVFDGGSVNSCQKGVLSVPFAGVTYTYDTPIPGCSPK